LVKPNEAIINDIEDTNIIINLDIPTIYDEKYDISICLILFLQQQMYNIDVIGDKNNGYINKKHNKYVIIYV